MDLDLVGYLYGLLEPEEDARTEVALRADPRARAQLERLRANLSPLAAIRDDTPPPAGLVDRTLALIAKKNPSTPIRQVSPSSSEPVFAPSRWRRIDAVVAASVMILVGGLGVSGVTHVKKRQQDLGCKNNLRQAHQWLTAYGSNNGGQLPQVTEQPPHNFAGAFVPILQNAGYMPQTGMPACPAVTVVVTLPAGAYAYSIGWRGPDGQLYGLHIDSSGEAALLPILADQMSPASHGNGYNVLYIGGNVRFTTSPNVGVNGDNIFDNQRGLIAPGLHQFDTVLAMWNVAP
jgi:prepilin-type processing-associated H-X9-DG protein